MDFVFHFASPASPIDYLRLPLHTLKVGAYGTHNALGLAKFKRARFLLASTSEVYGDPLAAPAARELLGQRQPDRPARRLRRGEALRRGDDDGVPPPAGRRHGIVRIFNTYGPRMRAFDGRAIPTFVRQALTGEPITVFGDGSQTRSFCYVDDLIAGHLALAESGEHEPVNIGNPEEFTLLELATQVIERDRLRSRIVFESLPENDPRSGGPTSPAPASSSAGSRRSRCARACSSCSSGPPGTN